MVRVSGSGTGVIWVLCMNFVGDDYVVCNCNMSCLDRKISRSLWLFVACFAVLCDTV
jgi:hypothetical protein